MECKCFVSINSLIDIKQIATHRSLHTIIIGHMSVHLRVAIIRMSVCM